MTSVCLFVCRPVARSDVTLHFRAVVVVVVAVVVVVLVFVVVVDVEVTVLSTPLP